MTGAILPAPAGRQRLSSAVETAATSDFVDARVRASNVRERSESNDQRDEDQSEHIPMMRLALDQHQSG
jgi:hypothetical protein